MMIETPDPQGTADALLSDGLEPEGQPEPTRRRPGRPRGSRSRKRRAGEPKAQATTDPQTGFELAGEPTEAEVQAMEVLGGTLWSFVAVRITGLSELEVKERHQLAVAMVPVFRKYASAFGNYEAEFTLLVIAGGLVMAHLPRAAEASSAEVVDDEPGR
jgi:hypothetical protein